MLLFNVSSLPFDVLCGGGFGTILPLAFTVDVWLDLGARVV